MTYRKFKADYLFTGKELAEPDSVLITTTDGTVQDLVPAASAGPDIEYFPGLLSPGFINCHCHLELSHLRGALPELTGLVDFLSRVMRLRGQEPEIIAGAIAAGEQEMLDGGIVACGDICNTTDTLAVKRAARIHYHNFVETMGFVPSTAESRFAQSLKIFEQFGEGRSIVPHAPYSVSEALLRLVADLPGNSLLTIHNQETEAENEFYLKGHGDFLRLYAILGLDVSFFKGTGKRSLESVVPVFHRDQRLILVHNVATREQDITATRRGDPANTGPVEGPDLSFCLCPNANLYISGLLPDVDMLVRTGCHLVVGTDSLASNHALSIIGELKTLQQHFPALSTPTLLQWATSNGAEALRMEDRLGSFVSGKKPGIVLIGELDRGRLTKGSKARRLL